MAAIYIARIEKIKDPTIRVRISVDDLDLIDNYKWYRAKHAKHSYACRSMKCEDGKWRNIGMHTVIAERMIGRPLLKNEVVDHIDGNGMNNVRDNLRVCTNKENLWNARRIPGKSGYVGVYEAKTKTGIRWYAQIGHEGVNYKLGRFDTPEAAYAAYCEAAKRLRGEFVNLSAPVAPPPPLPDFEPLDLHSEPTPVKEIVIKPVVVKQPDEKRVWHPSSNEEMRAIFDRTRILTDEDTQPIVIPVGWPYNVKAKP